MRACSLKKNSGRLRDLDLLDWNDDGSGFWSFWSLGFGECDIYCCYYYYYLFFFVFVFVVDGVVVDIKGLSFCLGLSRI